MPNMTMQQYNTHSYQQPQNSTPQQTSKIRTSISNFRKKILFQQHGGAKYSPNIIPKRTNVRSYCKNNLNTSNLIRVEDENSAVLLPPNNPTLLSGGSLERPIVLGDHTSNDSVTRLNQMMDASGLGNLVLTNQNSSKFRRQTVKTRSKPQRLDISANE